MKVADLGDVVTSAGLRWSVELAPERLWNTTSLQPHLSPILEDERLDRLAQTTGIEIRSSPKMIVAGHQGTVSWLVRYREARSEVERHFRERLTDEVTRVVYGHQRVLVRGRLGRRPRQLALIGRDVACFQFDGPQDKGPARIAVLYSEGALNSVPALTGDPLRAAATALVGSPPTVFFWPGPFDDPRWSNGLRGLLGASEALTVGATPTPDGALAVSLGLVGAFAPSGDEALRFLATAWGDLATSDLGHLLGLQRPRSEPIGAVAPEGLVWRVDLATGPLLDGLAAATVQDARSFLQHPGGAPGPD